MRKQILILLLSLGAVLPSLVQAGDLNVGVVISGEIQPGVYGRVELGNRPPPPLVYAQPVVIVAEPHHHYEPIYLHVPPGHAKNWRRYCGRYNACGRPVYFVKSAEYEPNYRHDHDHDHDHGYDHDWHDDDHDHGHGRGHDKHNH